VPKQLYAIFVILGLTLIADILSEDTPKIAFTIIIILGVKLKLKEAYLALKVYGHIFLTFLTYGLILNIQGVAGFSLSLSIGNYSLPESVAMAICLAILIIYICLIYSRASKEYFKKQIVPVNVTKYINGNIVACYFSFAIIGFSLLESFEIKYKNLNTSSFLSSSAMNLAIIKAHYTSSSTDFDKIALGLIKTDEKSVSELTYIPEDSRETLDKIKRVSNEIKQLITN